MLQDAELLVSVEWGEQRAGVRRTADGACRMTHGTTRNSSGVAGTRLERFGAAQIDVEGRAAVGGMLLADAASVQMLAFDDAWYDATVVRYRP